MSRGHGRHPQGLIINGTFRLREARPSLHDAPQSGFFNSLSVKTNFPASAPSSYYAPHNPFSWGGGGKEELQTHVVNHKTSHVLCVPQHHHLLYKKKSLHNSSTDPEQWPTCSSVDPSATVEWFGWSWIKSHNCSHGAEICLLNGAWPAFSWAYWSTAVARVSGPMTSAE